MDPLYINIANFIIKFKFNGPEEFIKLHGETIRRDIKKAFIGFVIPSAQKIDHCIEFYQRNNYDFFYDKTKNKNYLLFFKIRSRKKTETFYYISYLQFQLLLRNICQNLLLKHKGMIIHASASVINGEAHLFLGKSGAGKSTIVEILSKRYKLLADDMVIIRKEKDNFYAYQTPFLEKNGSLGEKTFNKYHIGGIYFLKKSDNYKIDLIKDKTKITNKLISQLFSNSLSDGKIQIATILDFLKSFENINNLFFGITRGDELIKLFI